MAWINIEVIEINGEVYGANIMTHKNGQQAIFKTKEEADLWLENNNKVGISYHTIEIW